MAEQYEGYPWSCSDVLSLLGVRFNGGKAENIIPCPFCGGQRFAMNIAKGTGHCFNCEERADSAGYFAAAEQITIKEARREIKRRLNLPDSSGKIPERIVFVEEPEVPNAPIEVRDKVYRAFLDELTLSEKNKNDLLARGFTLEDIEALGYKSYPDSKSVYYPSICRRLLSKGLSLEGVPGFYKNKKGDWSIPNYTLGILIPQVNCHNQIEGLQIRKDDDLRKEYDGKLEEKCAWFSSKGKSNGSGAHTSVHIASDFVWNTETKAYDPVLPLGKVTLTEGGMKADLVNCLLDSRVSVIAVQGVHALKPLKATLEELKKYGLTTVNIAFDMDYLTNPNVKSAMEKVEGLIKSLGLTANNVMDWQYKEEVNGETFYLKGLDDFLAYSQKGIKPKMVVKNTAE